MPTIENLSIKANRAIYALNSKARTTYIHGLCTEIKSVPELTTFNLRYYKSGKKV